MRIVVAMSGGVDSSVAAALLAEQGHDVIGVSMQLYDQSDGQTSFGSCCSIDDLHDARRVAAAIDIPHYILNFERQFDEQVVTNFVSEYASGRTPLPCARCNSDLKFATLAERAAGFGADAVATGHYARVERDEETGRYLLRRGVDSSKDQAYFLFSLTQSQLARAMFPVGDRPKEAVREYARQRQLPVAEKPDSQEICFIPDHDYASFVSQAQPGRRRTAARSSISTAACSAATMASIDSPSASARAWACPRRQERPRRRSTSSRSSPRSVRSSSDRRRALEQTTLTASGVNWILDPPTEGRRGHGADPSSSSAGAGDGPRARRRSGAN